MTKWMIGIASVILLIINIVATIILLTTVAIDFTIVLIMIADIAVTAHYIYAVGDYLIND